MAESKQITVDGRFWINRDSQTFLGPGRVELLEQIAAGHSIAEAARQLGMSYKTAWDMLNEVNQLADEPLFISVKGGRHGGGTTITPYGQQVITLFRHIEREYQAMLLALGQRFPDLSQWQPLRQRPALRTSARNQLIGTIQALEKLGHRILVTLHLGENQYLRALLTQRSIDDMGLSIGSHVFALIKAPLIQLQAVGQAMDDSDQLSTLTGEVINIEPDEVGGAEVSLQLSCDQSLVAVVDSVSMQTMPGVGEPFQAVIDARQVILATL